ncbi:aldo-keto reductase family 1 member B1-like [Clavelina lepadiformis]|uniref:aldo-keto reductase family 1 member B1-like n=1 Tax=Clavelina lepadiformis TaxID=159417 RepID=UPI004041DF13
MQSVKLNTGYDMPILGLGTWKSDKKKVQKAVEYALECGYQHLDCAYRYLNEEEVGAGIKNKINDKTVKREDIFVTDKLWCNSHKPEDVRPALMKTLESLQLEYLDLYLIHWPMGFQKRGTEAFPKDENGKVLFDDTDYVDTWKAMEDLQKEGLVRSIGVSNFNQFQINRILKECSVIPAVNQFEIHPSLTGESLVNYCQEKCIAVTGYCPLGCGDRPWGMKADDPVLLKDPKLLEIAAKSNKTAAQVALRYLVQRNIIAIPKSVTPERIRQNFQIFDFNLCEVDMKAINKMNTNSRICPMSETSEHKYYVFRENYSE